MDTKISLADQAEAQAEASPELTWTAYATLADLKAAEAAKDGVDQATADRRAAKLAVVKALGELTLKPTPKASVAYAKALETLVAHARALGVSKRQATLSTAISSVEAILPREGAARKAYLMQVNEWVKAEIRKCGPAHSVPTTSIASGNPSASNAAATGVYSTILGQHRPDIAQLAVWGAANGRGAVSPHDLMHAYVGAEFWPDACSGAVCASDNGTLRWRTIKDQSGDKIEATNPRNYARAT